MVNIKDVAREAGVSVATVSRLINNDPKVAPATKEKVDEAVKRLNYQPNLIGRNLRTACTNKILVLLPAISNQFYSRIIVSMEAAAEEQGYDLLLCITNGNPAKERKYLEMLQAHLVDAAISLSSSLSPKDFAELTDGYPLVQCCEFFADIKTPIVSIDNEQAGFDSAEYLISLGHRRIAFFGNNDKYVSSQLRLNGFRKAIAYHKIAEEQLFVRNSEFSFASGREAFLKLQKELDGAPLPTAIFCVSDSIAIGVMQEAQAQGIKIGTELSVMGFDNTAVSEICFPPLTTVSQPRADIGSTAIKLLFKKLKEKRSRNTKEFLPHTIVTRESTGKPVNL